MEEEATDIFYVVLELFSSHGSCFVLAVCA